MDREETGKRQLALIRTIQEGKDGRDGAVMELTTLCMGYIHKMAWHFGGAAAQEHEDLVSEGIYGLLEAVRTFDVSAGTSFLTYATPFIRHRMSMHMDGVGPLRLTVEARRWLGDERTALFRNPKRLEDLRQVVDGVGEAQWDPVAAQVEESDAVAMVRRAVAGLPEKEAAAVSAYYGIGGPRRSMTDVAGRLGISLSMAYRHLSKGLEKLRMDEGLKDLAGG